jgi:hypothetical protein
MFATDADASRWGERRDELLAEYLTWGRLTPYPAQSWLPRGEPVYGSHRTVAVAPETSLLRRRQRRA